MDKIVVVTAIVATLVISFSASAVSVTSFGPAELEGAPGLFGSAEAEISIFESTATGGTIDFALTNTSLLTELDPGMFANAFITEFQFDLPDIFEPIYNDCSVIAPVGVRFAAGAGIPVVATDIERTLDWSFSPGTGGGIIARAHEASENSNNNVLFSDNALDGSGIPVEDYAEGFFENSWEGAVFDAIIFRIKFEDSRPIIEGDLDFYAEDHLTLKFQGGNGSGWVGNHPPIPEPGTLFLLAPALLGIAGVLRRKFRNR